MTQNFVISPLLERNEVIAETARETAETDLEGKDEFV